jgi:hypothetical protein
MGLSGAVCVQRPNGEIATVVVTVITVGGEPEDRSRYAASNSFHHSENRKWVPIGKVYTNPARL